MNARSLIKMLAVGLLLAASMAFAAGPPAGSGGGNGGGGGNRPPTGEEAQGNNLSFPVIWAEGVTKALPGNPGVAPITTGPWWYQWGTNGSEPDVVPASCPPDPKDTNLCEDGATPGSPTADNPLPLVRAYLQKYSGNVWQAESKSGKDAEVVVDLIDWGDNLESVNWYTRSQVRTEVVLFKDVTPMTEYEMRHTSGWGTDEVHGLAVSIAEEEVIEGPGTQATVFSPCARLTIQKLLVARESVPQDALTWVPAEGWVNPAYIRPPIFNKAVHEALDGPGYYNAEINVKGRIIYGYTWNVRTLNDMTGIPSTAAGDYRITFSFDEGCPTALNTFFEEGTTKILVPTEEEMAVAAEQEVGSEIGGAKAVLDYVKNLTYIDVRILERSGGGKGGGGKGGGGKPVR